MVNQRFRTKDEFYGHSFALGTGYLSLTTHKVDLSSGETTYWTGEFRDPRGIVSVYRQENITTLSFACDGRLYNRTWRKYYGDRTVAQLARAFITDVHEDALLPASVERVRG